MDEVSLRIRIQVCACPLSLHVRAFTRYMCASVRCACAHLAFCCFGAHLHRLMYAYLHAKQKHRRFANSDTDPMFPRTSPLQAHIQCSNAGLFSFRTIPKSVSMSKFRKKECVWFSSK